MSFHRATLVALATFLTVGSASAAFAGCCQWANPAPVQYAPPGYAAGGCGGCGAAPIVYAPSGCGGCTAAPTVTYAPPVEAPAPLPPPPPAVTWGTGRCGCGRSVVYVAPPVAPTPIAPAPIYVVNQGPDYSGPGIMVPYRTYSPAWAPVAGDRYGDRYGYRYRAPGPRFAYRERFYHRHFGSRSRWWSYPRRPLNVRG